MLATTPMIGCVKVIEPLGASPQCRVGSLRCGEYRQCLIERRRHDSFRIDSIEVVSTRRNTGIARQRKIESVYEHVRTRFAGPRAEFVGERC